MTVQEMDEMIDVLREQRDAIEQSFAAIQRRIRLGERVTTHELESLSDLQIEAQQLREDVEHHIERCRDELNPDESRHEAQELNRLRSRTDRLENSIGHTLRQREQMMNNSRSRASLPAVLGRSVGRTAKRAVRKTGKLGQKTFAKLNPLNQKVNYKDVSDHGVESLRLAHQTVKKTRNSIKTVRSTINTTKKTIRVAEKTAKTSYRIAKQTAIRTYRVTRAVVRATVFMVVHIGAVLISPIFWIVSGLGVVLYIIFAAVIVLLGGSGTAQRVQQQATISPVGLQGDIPQDVQDALSYYRIACAEQKREFSDHINGLYYDINNLKDSDLVYMVRNEPSLTWAKSLATNNKKMQIIDGWDVVLPEAEAIAIVYVLLEKQANAAAGTNMQIYPVTYEQSQFNDLLDVCAVYTDTTYNRQECPDRNCAQHYHEVANPAYQTAVNNYNRSVSKYNDWLDNVYPPFESYRRMLSVYNSSPGIVQNAMLGALNASKQAARDAFNNWQSVFGSVTWEFNEDLGSNGLAWLGQFVDADRVTMNNTPQVIRTPYYTCDHQHTLHSIGLNFFDADAVMTVYGFTDTEREWEAGVAASYTAYLSTLTPP